MHSAGDLASVWVEKHVPEAQRMLATLQTQWVHIVGPQLRAACWPVSWERGLVTLAVRDASWLHELRYLVGELAVTTQAHAPALGPVQFRLLQGRVPGFAPPRLPPRPSPTQPPPFILRWLQDYAASRHAGATAQADLRPDAPPDARVAASGDDPTPSPR